MRAAVFSDTHSNWEALSTFVKFAEQHKIDQYWMLGDIVGYGAEPQRVADEVFRISDVVIRGNHDQAIADDNLLRWFNEQAREAVHWTRKQLNSKTKDRLLHLPYTRIEKNVTLTHATPLDPEQFAYIDSPKEAAKAFPFFKTSICFIGHTHLPQIFSEKLNASGYLDEGSYQLNRSDRYIISCGSIGQPRDEDSRLSFGIFDDEAYSLQLVRLPYPKEETAKKIIAAGLPKYFATRLL